MKQEISEQLDNVKRYISNIEQLNKLMNITYWDTKIIMPKKGLEQRAETLSYLDGQIFKAITSDEVKKFIDYFNPIINELSDVDKAMIRNLKDSYDSIKKIPEETYTEFSKVSALAQSAWEEAKEKNDFKIFQPHLEKVVNFQREFAEYYGYKDNKYDALLDRYEKGLTVKKLDKVFAELRQGILELLDYIKQSKKNISRDYLNQKFSIDKQRELSDFLLDIIKFDKEAGFLDETEHPFTLNIGNKDVRITTHYFEDDLLSNMFSVIHEGGHALYEMNIPSELTGTGLAEGASMSIHESQSRFYENIVGRSKEFLSVVFPKIKELFPKLECISLDDFYKAVNYVSPSLIRTDADELTYSLHIIIRYEIEKQLINGEIEVKDLPQVWKEKYVEYLGVEPKNDKEGVLQDMHWSDGSFGYFPSYALGNLYGGQFLHKMLQDNPDALKDIEKGNIEYINNWLKDNIHKYGCIYTPEELINKVTGEDLNTKYFLDYLNRKYKEIY